MLTTIGFSIHRMSAPQMAVKEVTRQESFLLGLWYLRGSCQTKKQVMRRMKSRLGRMERDAHHHWLQQPDDELHKDGDEEDQAPGKLFAGPLIPQRLQDVTQEAPKAAWLCICDEVGIPRAFAAGRGQRVCSLRSTHVLTRLASQARATHSSQTNPRTSTALHM